MAFAHQSELMSVQSAMNPEYKCLSVSTFDFHTSARLKTLYSFVAHKVRYDRTFEAKKSETINSLHGSDKHHKGTQKCGAKRLVQAFLLIEHHTFYCDVFTVKCYGDTSSSTFHAH